MFCLAGRTLHKLQPFDAVVRISFSIARALVRIAWGFQFDSVSITSTEPALDPRDACPTRSRTIFADAVAPMSTAVLCPVKEDSAGM